MAVFILGLGLVIVAGWLLFFQAGLDRWVPLGIAGAGLLLLIGLLVIGFSQNAASDRHVERIDEHHHH